MKLNLSAIALAIAVAGTAVPVLAHDAASQEAKQVVNLTDGSSLYVFKDGKMSMADKYGRPVRMNAGQVMEAKDGQRLTMVGDEVARLQLLQIQGHEQ